MSRTVTETAAPPRSRRRAAMGVRELDLSTCHPSESIVDRINAVPGMRTSTAFFTFLRANLVLSPSVLASNNNTPILGATSPPAPSSTTTTTTTTTTNTNTTKPSRPATLFSHPELPASLASPLSVAPPLVPFDDIPPLSLETLNTPKDKAEALDLVADSVAEMHHRATKALALHPLCLSGLSIALAAVYRFIYRAALVTQIPQTRNDASGLSVALASGILVGYVFATRYFSKGYLDLAKTIDLSWLHQTHAATIGEQDIMLGARIPSSKPTSPPIVGAVVLHIDPSPCLSSSTSKRRSRSISLRGGRGVIRAWTTSPRYRDRGIGKDLLTEAVRVTKEKCGRDAEVGFAKEHANSVMMLPSWASGGFRRDEMRAAKALEGVLAGWEGIKKKR